MRNAVWDKDEMSSIQNVDRLLPSQPYFQKMYKGKNFYGDLEQLLTAMYLPKVFDIKTKEGMTYAVMGSDLNTLHFYQFLIRSHGYKKVLELGTYIGVSAMYMADAGAHVTTVEMGGEFWRIANENFKANRFCSKIKSKHGDAEKYLQSSTAKYDLIFIDCAKEIYKSLLEMSLRRLNKCGMILVDDIFFQGDTLNDVATSEKGAGVREMIKYVAALEGYEKVILPIGNGLLMLRKL